MLSGNPNWYFFNSRSFVKAPNPANKREPYLILHSYIFQRKVPTIQENQINHDKITDTQKKAVKWYIDCGDDDFLYEGNCLVHIAMRMKEIPHEFRIRDGAHNWNYWRDALPVVLGFVSETFHQK